MAGDLEDFLKRAAERRAAKQRQQGGGGPAPQQQRPQPQQPIQRPAPQRPQPQQRYEEPIPVAEVVEPVNPLAEQQRRLEEAKKKAEEAREKLAKQMRGNKGKADQASTGVVLSGSPAEQLLAMLRQPNGIQQAFLLREILERPNFD
ncbi:MAG: hypothetical protein AAFX06_07445 [Planctomycetota bacterium]